MKNLTLKNFKKATDIIIEQYQVDSETAENMALNAFCIYQNFKNQYRDVEQVIYSFLK